MKKTVIIILAFCVTHIFPQSSDNSGFAILKFGNSARDMAMSDFGAVGNVDLANVYYNPAQLSSLKTPQLFFSHNSWIQDVSSQNIAGSSSLYGIPFAVQVNNTMINDIEVRVKPGEVQSKFDARYFSASFSTSARIYNNLFAGATFKYLYENILSDESSGYALDFGFAYNEIVPNLNLGMSVRNIGSVTALRTQSADLPTDFRVGASYNFYFEKISSSVNLISGIQKYLPETDLHFHIAAEYSYDETVFLRFGYVTGFESRNISFGLGFSWIGARLDYAYIPFDFYLGNSNTISLLYNF
ncbi:MAG: hypothetical protein CO129_04035 [Ignavibacteriales bacterium CG_4_9_14_3_um_filter_34_10]|nr:MAG: hypothetical protein CO129_04035 [Ignavibacteriales bacterium CG_4_9_14_3_um_filter_34_10]